MRKLIIDEEKCLKKQLSLPEALILAAASMSKCKMVIANLADRGILDETHLTVSPLWNAIINQLIDSDDEHLRQLASQMRECFPKGKKPGTVFYFRCNEREIVNKLKKFFEVYGDYSDEQIITATKKFVASYRGDYRFLPLIKYFISKNKAVMGEDGNNHIVEVSELASTLENMDDAEDIPDIGDADDWLMNSRN